MHLLRLIQQKFWGVDYISSFFLKLALPFIESSLALLITTSIEASTFSELWEIARVTPVFKDGDIAYKLNYCHISVSPVIARLFEKLAANQVYQHMAVNCLFSSGQSAYRRLLSTVTYFLNKY